jgi:hypothetical protein
MSDEKKPPAPQETQKPPSEKPNPHIKPPEYDRVTGGKKREPNPGVKPPKYDSLNYSEK